MSQFSKQATESLKNAMGVSSFHNENKTSYLSHKHYGEGGGGRAGYETLGR